MSGETTPRCDHQWEIRLLPFSKWPLSRRWITVKKDSPCCYVTFSQTLIMIGKTNYSDWRALLFWIYSLEHVFLEILHILIIKLLNIINMLSIVIVPIPKDLSCVPKLWQIIVLQIAGGSEKIAPDRGLIVVAASIFLQIAKCISPYIAKCICHKIQGAQSQSHKNTNKQTNKTKGCALVGD